VTKCKPKAPITKEHFRATELCKFHLAGACSRGMSCNFAHDVVELKAKPNFAKTRLCDSFSRTGRCAAGATCSFAHGKEEMRSATAESRKATRFASRSATSPSLFSPGRRCDNEAATATDIAALWDAGGDMFDQDGLAAPAGRWLDAGTTELKLGGNVFTASTTYSSERSTGAYSEAATTYSCSSDALSYEEPEDDMNTLLREIRAYTGTADAEQLDLLPGKVIRL